MPLCLLCGILAVIDLRRGIIPDGLNLSVAGLGLARAVFSGGAIGGVGAVTEAIAVGMAFWLFRRLYFALRKIQGLGLGDVKFLAASAPWVGITGLPVLLSIAALTALIAIGGIQLAGQRSDARDFAPVWSLSRARLAVGAGRAAMARRGLEPRPDVHRLLATGVGAPIAPTGINCTSPLDCPPGDGNVSTAAC